MIKKTCAKSEPGFDADWLDLLDSPVGVRKENARAIKRHLTTCGPCAARAKAQIEALHGPAVEERDDFYVLPLQ